MTLNMEKPIWVWLYITAEVRDGRVGMPPLSAWPDVHTYAFETEAEALAHPAKANWKSGHGYQLRKTYLQVKP